MPDTPLEQQNLCRVGISRGDTAVGCLGETRNSFGYGATAKFSTASTFRDYGEKFGVGDTVTVALQLLPPAASFAFYKNGKPLGTAIRLALPAREEEEEMPWNSAFFPHVLLKNVRVQMHFSLADGLLPVDGCQPWDAAVADGVAVHGPRLGCTSDCQVLMMVGLPGAGKTTWADNWSKQHPEKRYVILGTNLVLDQMKVPGLGRKRNYGERFSRLIDMSTKVFNTLLDRAARIPRNYILDQTNVYKSARKRKLAPFSSFYQIAIVVYPRPEDLRERTMKRSVEMGKEVPPEEVNKMRANFLLPSTKHMPNSDETFDEVWFIELKRADAARLLEREKRQLLLAGQSDHASQVSCVTNLAGVTASRESTPSVCYPCAIPRPHYPFAGQRDTTSSASTMLQLSQVEQHTPLSRGYDAMTRYGQAGGDQAHPASYTSLFPHPSCLTSDSPDYPSSGYSSSLESNPSCWKRPRTSDHSSYTPVSALSSVSHGGYHPPHIYQLPGAQLPVSLPKHVRPAQALLNNMTNTTGQMSPFHMSAFHNTKQ